MLLSPSWRTSPICLAWFAVPYLALQLRSDEITDTGELREVPPRSLIPPFRQSCCSDRSANASQLGAIGRRCIRVAAEVGGVILIIDAKNQRAAHWYASSGAIPLHDKPLTLRLPFATLERELRAAGQL